MASAPGRADFLNTHQDYKGLPVVPVAINLRARMTAKPTGSRRFTIRAPDLEEYGEESTDSFEVGDQPVPLLERGFFGNYFRAVVNSILRRGHGGRLRGVDVTVRSQIPIGSGLASSAAIEVAFTALLNQICDLGFGRREIAEVSFEAENREMGIPCGRLDQYGVSFGGVIKLECRPPYGVEELPFKDLTFAVVDSGIRHSTSEIHPRRQAEIDRGLKILMETEGLPENLKAKLGYRYDEPLWEEISENEIAPYLESVDEEARRRILFTVRMQRLTEFALKVLRREDLEMWEVVQNLGEEGWNRVEKAASRERPHQILGEVMNRQHALLRDLYDLSLPRLEDIREAALEAGAYGAKISGAGLGGSIVTLVRDCEVGRRVVVASLDVGARRGWVSDVGEGVRIESP